MKKNGGLIGCVRELKQFPYIFRNNYNYYVEGIYGYEFVTNLYSEL